MTDVISYAKNYEHVAIRMNVLHVVVNYVSQMQQSLD